MVFPTCGSSAPPRQLRVSVASSLINALTEIADRYEAANPGVKVEANFAASSTLREQILDGAPVDVFVSANAKVIDDLVAIEGARFSRPVFVASNRLALVVPNGNPAAIVGIEDLSKSDLYVGLCSSGVPCGDLATQALGNLGIEPNVDTYEPDVRALSARLIEGELDVALLYRSDVVAFPEDLQLVASPADAYMTNYPATSAATNPGAQSFVDYLTSSEAQAIMARWGFGAPHNS